MSAAPPGESVMPVVWSDLHRLHAPTTELSLGHAIPTFEKPSRADNILAALVDDASFRIVAATEHGRSPIDAVHDPRMIDFLESAWPLLHERSGHSEMRPDVFCHPAMREGMGPFAPPTGTEAAFGYWCFETATPLVEGTYSAARASADVALTATDLVLAGAPVVYGLCRPPGHHAATAMFGGFCFVNNAAVAAQHIVRSTGGRVTVLDVDYHHGNGTQQIFYDRADVQFVSLHGDPVRAYPYYTGFADETGTGPGRGATLNVPLPAGTDDDAYLVHLERVADEIDRFDPEVVVVSLGLDTFENDPISDLALTAEGYVRCGRLVRRIGRPLVVVQEGGYDVEALGTNARAWLQGCL